MYKEIDELVNAILESDIYIQYIQKEKNLYDEKTLALLSRHQALQDEYLKMKQYKQFDLFNDTKEKLREIKIEMTSNVKVQDYYQSYYRLNDLLGEMTQIIFQGISDDIFVEQFQL